jgi:hypothetical protein
MTQELQDLLLHYLGWLMYDFDNEEDYFKRRKIHQQIVHVNGLLGFEAPPFRNSLTSIVCHHEYVAMTHIDSPRQLGYVCNKCGHIQ